jgi:hypothetical protein
MIVEKVPYYTISICQIKKLNTNNNANNVESYKRRFRTRHGRLQVQQYSTMDLVFVCLELSVALFVRTYATKA